MPNDSHRPDVAVFIDFENVYVSVRDKLDANPNFEMIMDRCEDLGRVVIARAYADWYRYPRVTSALYANGIEPMYVPTYYYDREMGRTGRAIKNSVDMNLCIDAMKTLFTNTNIAKFVLATGDRDFIPLVNSIRQQGKEVIIIGIGGAASSHLAQSADEFIFYESLVGKKPAELLADQPKAKMPDKGREQVETEEEPPRPREAPAPPAPSAQPDVYDTLVSAINLARERGYVCSFGSLKLLMKELMGGDFKEGRYKDSAGKPFAKFKDFVLEAERRGKVQVFTSGTVNEVFLPGEDPYKLSQFAQELKEEPPPLIPAAPLDSRTDGRGGVSNNGRRRRRRSRGGQRSSRPEELALPEELAEEGTEEDEVEEIEYALPEEVIVPDLIDDTSVEFREDFYPEVSEEADLALIGPESPTLDAAQAEAVFGELLDRVEEEEAESQALAALDPLEIIELPALPRELEPAPEAQPAAETGEITPPGETQPIETQPVESQPFVEEEWRLLREIVARYDRPISFAQIHDAMRDARNNSGITRTNEELRTLIKQAINRGMLERSGRGNRVTYRLAPQPEGSEPATLETIEASAQETIEMSEPAAPETIVVSDEVSERAVPEAIEASEPVFHTPEAAAQAELVEAVPEAEAPPVVISADEPAAPAPKKPSRPRRKPAAPEAPAATAQPPRTGSRRKPAANAEPAVPAEAAAPRRSRTRKTETAAPSAEPAPARRSRRKKTDET